MMMGPTWSCSCRQHRWGCSGSQEQDPLLRFAWRDVVIMCLCLCFAWWHDHEHDHDLDGTDNQANEVDHIWMWKTYFCFNYLPRLSSWAGAGARLWSWATTHLNSSIHVFCFAIKFRVKLSTFQHEYLELTFTMFQLEYLEIFLGLLPPAARLLLPPIAKMMSRLV